MAAISAGAVQAAAAQAAAAEAAQAAQAAYLNNYHKIKSDPLCNVIFDIKSKMDTLMLSSELTYLRMDNALNEIKKCNHAQRNKEQYCEALKVVYDAWNQYEQDRDSHEKMTYAVRMLRPLERLAYRYKF